MSYGAELGGSYGSATSKQFCMLFTQLRAMVVPLASSVLPHSHSSDLTALPVSSRFVMDKTNWPVLKLDNHLLLKVLPIIMSSFAYSLTIFHMQRWHKK
jgi:amino acid permease